MPALALAISQRIDLPEVIGRILAARGVAARRRAGVHRSRGCATRCPTPRICTTSTARSSGWPTPWSSRRAGRACSATTTSTAPPRSALLARYLRAVGGQVAIDVPDRLARGLRPQPEGARAARGAGLPARRHARLRHHRVRGAGARGRARPRGDRGRSPRRRGAPAARARRDQPEPAATRCSPVGRAGRGRRHLPAGRGAQPARCARAAVSQRRGRSPTCAAGSIWWRSARSATWCRSRGLNRALVDPGAEGRGARRGNPGLAALAAAAGLGGAAPAPSISASCSGRGSTPAAAPAARASRPSCCWPTMPDEIAPIVARMEHLNQERRAIERRVLAAAERQARPGARGRAAAAAGRGRGLVAGRGRPRRRAPGRAPPPAGRGDRPRRTGSARAPGARSRASISARR